MKSRVAVVAIFLSLGYGIGRVSRDDDAARSDGDRRGATADRRGPDANDPAVSRESPLPPVHGRLLLPSVWTPATVEVRLDVPAPDGRPLRFERMRLRRTATRADGYRFRFADVAPGRYRLAASIDGREPDAEAFVRVSGRPVERDLELAVPEHEGHARLRAVGPDGEDAGAMQVSLRIDGPAGSIGLAGGTRSLGGGLYLLKLPDEIPETFDTCTIRLMNERYGERTIEYDPRAKEPPLVRFEQPARLVVTVAGYEASPHAPHLRIRQRPAGSSRRSEEWRGARLDGRGRLDLAAVQPGELELHLCVLGEPLASTIAVRTVRVEPGENRVELAIPALHAQRFARARRDVESIGVRRVADAPFDTYRIATFETAETTVERLLPGAYEVSGHSDGKNWTRRVQIPAAEPIRVP